MITGDVCNECSMAVSIYYRQIVQREKSGWPQTWNILRDFSEYRKLREFSGNSVQPRGKNCNKQSIFSLSFKYLCKTAVDWVNRIARNRDEVRVRWWPVILLELMWNDPWWRSFLRLRFVAITHGKVSLWLWKSLENSGNFFLLLCGYPANAKYIRSLKMVLL